MDAIGMDNIATLDDLTTYAEKAKEQYGLYATYELADAAYIIRGTSDRNLITVDKSNLWIDQDTKEFVSLVDSPEFEAAVKLYNNWYNGGLNPKGLFDQHCNPAFPGEHELSDARNLRHYPDRERAGSPDGSTRRQDC